MKLWRFFNTVKLQYIVGTNCNASKFSLTNFFVWAFKNRFKIQKWSFYSRAFLAWPSAFKCQRFVPRIQIYYICIMDLIKPNSYKSDQIRISSTLILWIFCSFSVHIFCNIIVILILIFWCSGPTIYTSTLSTSEY